MTLVPPVKPGEIADFEAFNTQVRVLVALHADRCGSMAKAPSLAGQSSPSPPPHLAIFGFGLLYALWRSHAATQRALRG